MIKDLLMFRKCETRADKVRTASFLLFCCHDTRMLFFIYCYCKNFEVSLPQKCYCKNEVVKLRGKPGEQQNGAA